LDGEEVGLQEWVTPDCLLAPWSDLDAFTADDAAESALAEASREVRGTTAFEAARLVLSFVRPKKNVRLRRGVADAGVLEISGLDETAKRLELDPAELRSDPMFHEKRGGLCLVGWPVTERLARRAAERLAALRAEVTRLGELVERAVQALRDRGHGVIASTIARDLGVHIATLDPDVRR
jgi:hypothetical protein